MAPNVVIITHPKENLKKCSLQPLKDKQGFVFHSARNTFRFDATGYILLTVEAPVLSPEDAGRPLLLLDSTWRLLPKLESRLDGQPIRRRLPPELVTAYPRQSKIAEDPLGGLASIEALYAALYLLGFPSPTLLDHYYWKDEFLRLNGSLFP